MKTDWGVAIFNNLKEKRKKIIHGANLKTLFFLKKPNELLGYEVSLTYFKMLNI